MKTLIGIILVFITCQAFGYLMFSEISANYLMGSIIGLAFIEFLFFLNRGLDNKK